jgi:hypothetical protein
MKKENMYKNNGCPKDRTIKQQSIVLKLLCNVLAKQGEWL